MTSNFSHETFEVRRNWHTIFQALKEKNCQSRILYPGKFQEWRNDCSVREGKLRERFVSWSKLSLYCLFLSQRISFTISIQRTRWKGLTFYFWKNSEVQHMVKFKRSSSQDFTIFIVERNDATFNVAFNYFPLWD